MIETDQLHSKWFGLAQGRGGRVVQPTLHFFAEHTSQLPSVTTMATAHSTSKGRKTRNRPLGRRPRPKIEDSETPPASCRSDIRVRGALLAFLESERDVLVKTQSLLVCIAQAMHVEHPPAGPYYPDVVGLAQDLLKSRVFNLDELLLDGRLPAGHDPQSR